VLGVLCTYVPHRDGAARRENMRMRTGSRVVAVLAAAALIAAACGDDNVTPDTGTDVEDGDGDGDGDGDAEGELGSVTYAEGEAIQIRSLEAISGDVAFLGVPNQRATQLAIEDYGDINGFSVELGTPYDDLCSADGGQASAQTIVSDDTVVGVIGTSCSGAGVPASDLISNAGMVMISASNTNPDLTQNPFGTEGGNFSEGYYRTAHNDLFQGEAVADFAFNELGLTQMAAVHDGDPYTDGLTTAFREAFEALGGEVVVYTAVNKGDTDMVPVLTEVAAGSPEGLFVPIFPPEINRVAEQVTGVSGLEDVVLISADGAQVESFLEIQEAEGFYFSGPNLQFEDNANEITGKSAAEFLEDYNTEFGEAPSAAFWAHAYDATTMLLRAIETVGVVGDDGALTIDRAALRDELYSSSFQGLIGGIACDEFGDCGAGEIQIILHEDSSQTDATQIPVVYTYIP
jgi:branched-chain amino acid transport system substrate-binding protein